MNSKFTILLGLIFVMFLSLSLQALPLPYDTLTIKQIQYVPDPQSDDTSPFYGDTVVVKGLVMHSPRELYVGSRWATYIVDPDSFPNPWSGFFIIQHDTFATGTNFGFVEPGMICYFTGVIDEYSHLSQLAILTDPVTPIEILSVGNSVPNPVVLTALDLQDRTNGEQWESAWVKINDATITNNALGSNRASITDASGGTTFLDDYFWWFRSRFNAGTYSWPPAGTNINVQGFVRDVDFNNGAEPFTINPRDTLDMEILSNPPVISDVMRDPGTPTSTDNVTVSATIVDNTVVANAKVHFSVNWGSFQEVTMTATADTFSAVIPAQSDGSFVRYFISAVDNVGDFTTFPGDTSISMLFYVVRDAGLSIKDVQYTWGYPDDASGYEGYEVTVEGVVTTDSSDFIGSYYIEEKDSAWYGIWIRDANHTFIKGDWIQVTGTVEEDFGVTRINNVTDAHVVTPNFGIFNPVVVTTGEVATGGAHAEDYESVLIKVENLTVTNPFPDAPSNFGEFMVNDGTGDLRVDDRSSAFSGNLDSTFHQNDHINAIIALGYYSYGNYKIIPRDTSDIIGHITDISENLNTLPEEFSLEQNYPNPFNPSTKIHYNVAASGDYELAIYNILGQKIVTLKNGYHTAGKYRVTWNGLDRNGIRVSSGIYFYTLKGDGISLTRKMILLK